MKKKPTKKENTIMIQGKFVASTVNREAWGTVVILSPQDQTSNLPVVALTLNPGKTADSFQGGKVVELTISTPDVQPTENA